MGLGAACTDKFHLIDRLGILQITQSLTQWGKNGIKNPGCQGRCGEAF